MTRRGRWLYRHYQWRWGAVILFPYRRFLWGLEANLLADSWDLYLWPVMVRVHLETFCRARDWFRRLGRSVRSGSSGLWDGLK